MTRKMLLIWAYCLVSTLLAAQKKQHSLLYHTGYYQIRDALNYGLVHHGGNFRADYTFRLHRNRSAFEYTGSLGTGIHSRKGAGLMIFASPADLYHGWTIRTDSNLEFEWGLYVSAIYQWQLYPFLQSGHLFWRTSLETGPRVRVAFPFRERPVRITMGQVLLGFSSRPEPGDEEYFYSRSGADFIRFAHSGLEFGFLHRMNHFLFHLEITNPEGERWLGYRLEYFNTSYDPRYDGIFHSITLRRKLGG